MSESTQLIRRKGVCENPDCDMCLSKTVQEIEPGEDFICADCGSPLKEAKDITVTPPRVNKGLIAAIVGVVILGGGAAGWFLMDGSKKSETPVESITLSQDEYNLKPGETVKAEITVLPEGYDEELVWTSDKEDVATVDGEGNITAVAEGTTIVTVKSDNTETNATVNVSNANVDPDRVVTPENPGGGSNGGSNGTGSGTKYGTVSLSYGSYTGPLSGGRPDGMGGEFTFTRSMTLDLKDGYGNTVEINPGDKIVDAKFTDGKLRQGEIHFKDNSRKYISGLNQAL